MTEPLTTKENVLKLANQLILEVRSKAEVLDKNHPRPGSRPVWTTAVWEYFDTLRNSLGEGWDLYPGEIGRGTGRMRGEYLVDFMLMDKRGPRIACESEWGGIDAIDWAFDKLRGVKSDIKIFLFQIDFTPDGLLPPKMTDRILPYMKHRAHFSQDECFLLLQWSGSNCRPFFWQAPPSGSFESGIEFVPLT